MRIDLTGQRFGLLLVLGPAGTLRRRNQSTPLWHCRCDCGAERIVRGNYLRYGQTTRCVACIVAARRGRPASEAHRRAQKHRRPTPERQAYSNMVQRCENPRHPHYRNYGGRGIAICARWRESFAAFLADVGPRPSPAHSLDRIDNERGYEPANCRWATRAQQQQNRRHTRAAA